MSASGRHARDRRAFVPSPRAEATPITQGPRAAVRSPDPSELVWLEEARELLRGPQSDLTDVGWLGAQLDVLMGAWHACPTAERWNPTPTTTALGIAVGDAVIARVPGLEWVYVLEPGGSRFAIAHRESPLLEHPIEAVGALWVDGSPGTLRSLVDQLVGHALRVTATREEPDRLTGALRLLGLRR